jgi:hypothetical protein
MSNSKKSHFTPYFILLAIGFILIALDVNVKTNIRYPQEYANTTSVTGEFQYYNIASLYGATCTYKLIDTSSNNSEHPLISGETSSSPNASGTKVIDKVFFDNIHIDIFNDVLGFTCILFACMNLRKVNRRFSLAALSSLCGIVLNLVLALLPFTINGLRLCTISMLTGTVYLACNVITTFLFASGLFMMCPQICCRDERKWGKMTWFISFTLQILITFIFWLGSDFNALYTLGGVLECFLIADIIGFWLILKRTLPYMEKSYIESRNFSMTNS